MKKFFWSLNRASRLLNILALLLPWKREFQLSKETQKQERIIACKSFTISLTLNLLSSDSGDHNISSFDNLWELTILEIFLQDTFHASGIILRLINEVIEKRFEFGSIEDLRSIFRKDLNDFILASNRRLPVKCTSRTKSLNSKGLCYIGELKWKKTHLPISPPMEVPPMQSKIWCAS